VIAFYKEGEKRIEERAKKSEIKANTSDEDELRGKMRNGKGRGGEEGQCVILRTRREQKGTGGKMPEVGQGRRGLHRGQGRKKQLGREKRSQCSKGRGQWITEEGREGGNRRESGSFGTRGTKEEGLSLSGNWNFRQTYPTLQDKWMFNSDEGRVFGEGGGFGTVEKRECVRGGRAERIASFTEGRHEDGNK